jgi:hypothetical protein
MQVSAALTHVLLAISVTNLLFYICAEKEMKKKKHKRKLLTTFKNYYIMNQI